MEMRNTKETNGNKYTKKIFKPGEVSHKELVQIEEFRFPQYLPPISPSLQEEVEIDRQYNNRSIFIVFYMCELVIATIRIIGKIHREERLPIEFSKSIPTVRAVVPILTDIDRFLLPICEIGGFKVSDSLTYKLKYEIINDAIKSSINYIRENKFTHIFITCKKKLESFYCTKFSFRPYYDIIYGNKSYSSLVRSTYFNGTPYQLEGLK